MSVFGVLWHLYLCPCGLMKTLKACGVNHTERKTFKAFLDLCN